MHWLRPPHIWIGAITWTLIEWKWKSLKANSFSTDAFIAIRVQLIVSITFVKPVIAENCLLSVSVEFYMHHVFKIHCSISGSWKKNTFAWVYICIMVCTLLCQVCFLLTRIHFTEVFCAFIRMAPGLLSCNSLWAAARIDRGPQINGIWGKHHGCLQYRGLACLCVIQFDWDKCNISMAQKSK